MSCSNLIDLNDDCLLCIASFLHLRDLLSFEHVCQRTQQVARLQYRKYRRYRLLLREEGGESDKVLSSIGEFIECMEFSCGFTISSDIKRRILGNIARFCEKMHTIILRYFSLNSIETIEDLQPLANCKALKTIYLINCDANSEFLQNYEELKHVKIIDYHQ
ncbi:uncharacterized protein LOC132255417 [Phlebotomus argentipes]|uniref:uncharacterized protein LOC132255417 n=1 Tax=Phlebotomus argentipes TaxID=94469 RepID=UPI0028935C79|nr:uncharacterized protein LOC132255417 [Phlebotomus argentipes]